MTNEKTDKLNTHYIYYPDGFLLVGPKDEVEFYAIQQGQRWLYTGELPEPEDEPAAVSGM